MLKLCQGFFISVLGYYYYFIEEGSRHKNLFLITIDQWMKETVQNARQSYMYMAYACAAIHSATIGLALYLEL